MPHLDKLCAEFAPADVRFYALNIWEDGDPIAYVSEKDYGFQVLLAADDVAQDYGVKGTPAVIAVDADRRVIYVRKLGASPAQVTDDLRTVLKKLGH
jgi:hypothetical protein